MNYIIIFRRYYRRLYIFARLELRSLLGPTLNVLLDDFLALDFDPLLVVLFPFPPLKGLLFDVFASVFVLQNEQVVIQYLIIKGFR